MIRKRGLYCTKDTFVTTALMLPEGANIAWLENRTGVAYATLRRHYGEWTTGECTQQTRFADIAPELLLGRTRRCVSCAPGTHLRGAERGRSACDATPRRATSYDESSA